MLIFLTLLLALNGGAFGPSTFNALSGNEPAAPVSYDGSSGPPDHLVVVNPPPPPTSGNTKFRGAPRWRLDGSSGPPDHPVAPGGP